MGTGEDVGSGLWASVKHLAAIDGLVQEVSDKIPERLDELRRDIQDHERRVADRLDTTRLAIEGDGRDIEARLSTQLEAVRRDASVLSREVSGLKTQIAYLLGLLAVPPRGLDGDTALSGSPIRPVAALPPKVGED